MRPTNFFQFLAVSLTLYLFISGCGSSSRGTVEIWIDSPMPGGRVMPGEQVVIQSHAFSKTGIVEIELSVDGEPLTRNAPSHAGADLVTLEQTWVATTPGMHSLQLTGFSSDGRRSNPRVVVIEVRGPETETPIPPTPTTPLTETALPTSTPTLTPTLTPSITPSTTSTIQLPPKVSFSADDESLDVGECTFLRWQVENADTITLNGKLVSNQDARQVCPDQTTSYVLQAKSSNEEVSRNLTIQVTIPIVKDTSNPEISNITVKPKLIFDNPACGADQAQISANIQDEGSGVKRVDLYYQVVTSQTGELVSMKMNGSGNGTYSLTLGQEDLTRSLALYGGGVVRFYLIAVDQEGNSSITKTYSFQTEACLL